MFRECRLKDIGKVRPKINERKKSTKKIMVSTGAELAGTENMRAKKGCGIELSRDSVC